MEKLLTVGNSEKPKQFIDFGDDIGLILNEEGIDDFTENDIEKYKDELGNIVEKLKIEYEYILNENKDLNYAVNEFSVLNKSDNEILIKIRNFINKIQIFINKDKNLIVSEYFDMMHTYYIVKDLNNYIKQINKKEIKDELIKLLNFNFKILIEKINKLVYLLKINDLLEYPYYKNVNISGEEINIAYNVQKIVEKVNNKRS